ncbi:hypothetical protein D3C76_1665140 [compost metagenome]
MLCSLANSVMRYSTALAIPRPSAYTDMPITRLGTEGNSQVPSIMPSKPIRNGHNANRTRVVSAWRSAIRLITRLPRIRPPNTGNCHRA